MTFAADAAGLMIQSALDRTNIAAEEQRRFRSLQNADFSTVLAVSRAAYAFPDPQFNVFALRAHESK
jgi:hypothetical protein